MPGPALRSSRFSAGDVGSPREVKVARGSCALSRAAADAVLEDGICADTFLDAGAVELFVSLGSQSDFENA